MSKLRNGFSVVGPNTLNLEEHIWYCPTLEDARRLADSLAAQVDAEYEIYQYIGAVRQVVVPPRPIEFVPAETQPTTPEGGKGL